MPLVLVQDAPLPPLPPIPPTPPTPDAAPVTVAQGPVIATDGPVTPADLLRAMQAQREQLGEQLRGLEHRREEIMEQITEQRAQGLDISGLEQRVKDVDLRIRAIDQQIALADAHVAQAAAVPGAVQPDPPPPPRDGPPEEVFVLSGIFIVAVLMPLAVGYARRLWKRSAAAVSAIPSDLADRLRGIEHAVESVALEVERIGEGQRFMSRVFTDRTGADARALGEGAAQPIDVAARQKVAEQR